MDISTTLRRPVLFTAAVLSTMSIVVGESSAGEPGQVLFDFDAASDARRWTSVNDDVMGGVSEGAFRVDGKGTMVFYGDLSLENRGGFASVRTEPGKLDLSAASDLVFRIRGDGRSYYCNLYVPTRRIAFSYRAKFDTQAGRWQEVRLPLSSFRATWFGRELPAAASLDASNLRGLGFLIADKKSGPFELEVDWIRTTIKGSSAP